MCNALVAFKKSTLARNLQFLTPSPFVRLCSFYMYPPALKKFRGVYESSNGESGSEKGENNYFFCKLNIKDHFFYTVTKMFKYFLTITYQKENCLLFENSGFVRFCWLFKDSPLPFHDERTKQLT